MQVYEKKRKIFNITLLAYSSQIECYNGNINIAPLVGLASSSIVEIRTKKFKTICSITLISGVFD